MPIRSPSAAIIYRAWLHDAARMVGAIPPSPLILQVARDALDIDDAQHEADRLDASRAADGDRAAIDRLRQLYSWEPDHDRATTALSALFAAFQRNHPL